MIIMNEMYTDGMIMKASEPTNQNDFNDLSKKMIGMDPNKTNHQITSELTGIPASLGQNKSINNNPLLV